MKKKLVIILMAAMVLSVAGCSSTKSQDTTFSAEDAKEKLADEMDNGNVTDGDEDNVITGEPDNADGADEADENKQDAPEDAQTGEEADTSLKEEEPATVIELTEEQKAKLAETLNAILNVKVGAAGSSLRMVSAGGQLLDLSEMLTDQVSADALKQAISEWKAANLDETNKEWFEEGLDSAQDCAENYMEDPTEYEGLVSDCGYEFAHQTYEHPDYLVFLCNCITSAQ